MNRIKINNWSEIPGNFTGIAECKNGDVWWFKNGLYHRETNPCKDCFLCYNNEQTLCDEPGPAKIYKEGTRVWHKNSYSHREAGPAIIFPNGRKDYWINGEKISKKSFELFCLLKYKRKYEEN